MDKDEKEVVAELSEQEFNELKKMGLHFNLACIFLPALCLSLIMFGYLRIETMILHVVLSLLVIPSFVIRTRFLIKYPQYNLSTKRFRFETYSYIACLIFAFGTAFLVHEPEPGVIAYYFLNIYIQPAFIVFTFVILGVTGATTNRIVKIYFEEEKRRRDQAEDLLDKENEQHLEEENELFKSEAEEDNV